MYKYLVLYRYNPRNGDPEYIGGYEMNIKEYQDCINAYRKFAEEYILRYTLGDENIERSLSEYYSKYIAERLKKFLEDGKSLLDHKMFDDVIKNIDIDEKQIEKIRKLYFMLENIDMLMLRKNIEHANMMVFDSDIKIPNYHEYFHNTIEYLVSKYDNHSRGGK